MQAHPILLQIKYARIIAAIAQKQNIEIIEALALFYNSATYKKMRQGIGEMHCLSDLFLAENILQETEK